MEHHLNISDVANLMEASESTVRREMRRFPGTCVPIRLGYRRVVYSLESALLLKRRIQQDALKRAYKSPVYVPKQIKARRRNGKR